MLVGEMKRLESQTGTGRNSVPTTRLKATGCENSGSSLGEVYLSEIFCKKTWRLKSFEKRFLRV